MIPYNELRYGNWIAFGVNHVSVRSLHKDTFLDDKEPHIYVDRFANFKSYCLLISQVDPIPLTPELLVKAGFNHDFEDNPNDSVIFSNDRFHLDVINGAFLDYLTKIEIKSVHQLQNLYFALTSKELKINLEI